MWDALKKIDRVLMAVARPFVWFCVILFAIGFIGGLISAILTSSHTAQTLLILFLFALIVVVLLAVIVWLVRRRHAK